VDGRAFGLWLVADGVGGDPQGESASRIAVETVSDYTAHERRLSSACVPQFRRRAQCHHARGPPGVKVLGDRHRRGPRALHELGVSPGRNPWLQLDSGALAGVRLSAMQRRGAGHPGNRVTSELIFPGRLRGEQLGLCGLELSLAENPAITE
jgi:hypothetical protein